MKARTQEEAAGKAQQAYAAQRAKAPPMPVKARTQEEAAEKAQQAYAAKPKAEAKTGRNFFERLRPEKVCSEADVNSTRGANTGSHACSSICTSVASHSCWQNHESWETWLFIAFMCKQSLIQPRQLSSFSTIP